MSITARLTCFTRLSAKTLFATSRWSTIPGSRHSVHISVLMTSWVKLLSAAAKRMRSSLQLAANNSCGRKRRHLPIDLAVARGAKAESAGAQIEGDIGEPYIPQSRGNPLRMHRHKCAPGVHQPVQPSIRNFKGKKLAAGPQDPMNFPKGAILLLAGAQVMQGQNRDH